jgi:hypothetical protein
MTQLSITVKGATLVRQGLQDLAAEIPKIGKGQIYKTEQAVVRRMKEYWTINSPPALPSYQRTGKLAGGYFIEPLTNGYRIVNRTAYTSLVVGDAYGLGQAWFHSQALGRHMKVRDVQEHEVLKLPPEIENEITMVARRKGF